MFQAIFCLIPMIMAFPYDKPTYRYFITDEYVILFYLPASQLIETEGEDPNNQPPQEQRGYAIKVGNQLFSYSFEILISSRRHFDLFVFFAEHWLQPFNLRDFAELSRHWQGSKERKLETIVDFLRNNWL